jgi:long-chain acyl-CoA synthetase
MRSSANTLGDRFRLAAEANPQHPAILWKSNAITYGELARGVAQLANRLRESGAGSGTRVAIALPNGPAFIRAFFATAHAGGVVVPINPVLTETEMASLLGDAGVEFFITDADLHERCTAALLTARGEDREAVFEVDDDDAPDASGEGEGKAIPWSEAAATSDDPVLYLYSSGSTGKPKRIVRTHFNLLYETDRLTKALGFSPEVRVIGVAPFSHVNGLTRSMLASMVSGATLVPLPRYERRSVARAIEEHRINIFIGVPFMFQVLAESRWPEPVDFSSLRHCFSSSAPLPQAASVAFNDRYGLFVRQLYGSSETGTIALNLADDPRESLESVGLPIEGVEVEIFGEDGTPAVPGEEGDIGIRSPAATTLYPGLPEATAKAFQGGFFFPGDVGRKDANGNICLIGRKSLFINCGGYKVNPYEVEQVLERHPAVGQAVVAGVDTPYGDQRVRAVVVPKGECSRDELIALCRDRLADYKVPSVIEFREQLPTSAAGKVQRQEL